MTWKSGTAPSNPLMPRRSANGLLAAAAMLCIICLSVTDIEAAIARLHLHPEVAGLANAATA
jgi:hypothetical protein